MPTEDNSVYAMARKDDALYDTAANVNANIASNAIAANTEEALYDTAQAGSTATPTAVTSNARAGTSKDDALYDAAANMNNNLYDTAANIATNVAAATAMKEEALYDTAQAGSTATPTATTATTTTVVTSNTRADASASKDDAVYDTAVNMNNNLYDTAANIATNVAAATAMTEEAMYDTATGAAARKQSVQYATADQVRGVNIRNRKQSVAYDVAVEPSDNAIYDDASQIRPSAHEATYATATALLGGGGDSSNVYNMAQVDESVYDTAPALLVAGEDREDGEDQEDAYDNVGSMGIWEGSSRMDARRRSSLLPSALADFQKDPRLSAQPRKSWDATAEGDEDADSDASDYNNVDELGAVKKDGTL